MVFKNIDLKTWENNCVTLYAQQGEIDSRYIKVTFKNYDLSNLDLTGKTVTIYAKKPDNTQIFNTCTVDTTNNTATVKLTSQFLSSVGIFNCEFQIFEGSTILLKVNGLKISVFSTENFSEAIESTSEYNTLLKSIEQAQAFADNTGDISDLNTTNKSSIISAINELVDNAGSITNLNTTNKASIVDAVNELNSKTIPITQGGTGGTTESEARTNLEVLKAYILYNNDAGNGGTVILNDNADNYEFLDIIIWDFYVTRIYNRNNRPIGLMKIGGYGGKYFEWHSEALAITRNTITRSGVTHGIISNSGSVQIDTTSHIPIRSVVGYKY